MTSNKLAFHHCRANGCLDWKSRKIKEEQLAERKKKLRKLLKEDEIKQEKAREEVAAKAKQQQSSKAEFYPEVSTCRTCYLII